jgi:hypothetical protein
MADNSMAQVNRMLYLANKAIPMPLNYQPLLLVQAQMALLSMASQRIIIVADQSYDFPALVLSLRSAAQALTIKSSKPSPFISPALETDRPL